MCRRFASSRQVSWLLSCRSSLNAVQVKRWLDSNLLEWIQMQWNWHNTECFSHRSKISLQDQHPLRHSLLLIGKKRSQRAVRRWPWMWWRKVKFSTRYPSIQTGSKATAIKLQLRKSMRRCTRAYLIRKSQWQPYFCLYHRLLTFVPETRVILAFCLAIQADHFNISSLALNFFLVTLAF